MNTRNRIKTVFIIAVMAMVVLAQAALAALPRPSGSDINPATGANWANGDTYRLAFITSAKHDAISTDITVYNTWVQGLADASTAYDISAADGVTWNVIGSTAYVDARDNTSTNPTVGDPNAPILLLDTTTIVAVDNFDLWDGVIQNIINITETGTTLTGWPWTGTMIDGTLRTGGINGGPLGSSGEVGQGDSSKTADWVWRAWTMDPPGGSNNMYALSDPLVVGGLDPNLPSIATGDNMLTWSGQEVTLNTTVTNNDTTVPQGELTYAWTVDAASLADGNLTIDVTNADQEDVTVKVTKTADTGNATVVTMKLAVTLEGKPPVDASMKIDVYDNSCKAAQAVGTVNYDQTDLNKDCLTNLKDFAEMALTWMDEYASIGPMPK